MNNTFQQYVTGQAFVLTMSKAQIEALHWCSLNDREKHDYPTVPYAMTMDSLTRKGLVTRAPTKVTKEGELVLELCRRAGLVKLALKMKYAA